MPNFTVLNATYKGDIKNTNWGPKRDITLTLQDESGHRVDASWWTNGDTPLPVVGTTIEGTIELGQYGPKFKKGQPGAAPGAPNASMSGGDSVGARIVRQHSQEMAIRALNMAPGTPLTQGRLDEIRRLANWFDDDVDFGVQRRQNTDSGLPLRREPVPTTNPEPTTPSLDEYLVAAETVPDADDIPF